jgi:hypothetical protein
LKRRILVSFFLLILVITPGFSPTSFAIDFDWETKRQIKLDVTPLDVASSTDGKWIIVLVPSEVQIYSAGEGAPTKRIPIDAAFDRIAYSEKDNLLILGSASKKSIGIVQLETIFDIVISGRAFKGPEVAPVTIAVFGDYQ